MDNNLGLTVVMNLQDNMSAKVRMLNAQLNQLTRSLNQAQGSMRKYESIAFHAMIDTANMAADALNGLGMSFLRVASSAAQAVIQQGTFVDNTMRTLTSLYKSSEEAEKAFQWVKDFALHTPFNFEDLMPALTMMKAVGIDVRKNITATTGETQNLLMYAGDLAAVFPEMRNMYGTGVKAAMGALKEYIAEGNVVSLRRGAGLDMKSILKEEVGTKVDMATRERQVADLITKLGIFGMTSAMAGTAAQRIANLEDVWQNFLIEISKSGVFETYTRLINQFADAIQDMDLEGLAHAIGEALTPLIYLVGTLIRGMLVLVNLFISFVNAHPLLVKITVWFASFAGSLMISISLVGKLVASFLTLGSTMAQVIMAIVTGSKVGMLHTMYKVWRINLIRIIRAYRYLKGTIMLFYLQHRAMMLGFGALGLGLYAAWQKNIFGIRTSLSNFFRDFGEALGLIWDAIDGSMGVKALNRARELGLLPYINAFMALIDMAKDFGEAFINGFSKAGKKMADFFLGDHGPKADDLGRSNSMIEGTKGYIPPGLQLIKTITDNTTIEGVKSLGDSLGQLAGTAIPLMILSKAIEMVALSIEIMTIAGGVIKYIFGGELLLTVLGAIGAIKGFLLGGFLAFVPTWVTTYILVPIMSVFGVTIGWAAAIAVAFFAACALIYVYWEDISKFFKRKWTEFKTALGEWGDAVSEVFGGMANSFKKAWGSIVSWFEGTIIGKMFSGKTNSIDIKDETTGEAKTVAVSTGLRTGGYVTGQGIAMLHPNEVVLNSDLINRLATYLGADRSPTATPTSSGSNSVVFEKGSIVFQVQGTDQSSVEHMADKLMQIIQRKAQLNNFAVRTV